MIYKSITAVLIGLVISTGCLIAQPFAYTRMLMPDSNGGWHRFILPAAVVGKTKANLADLRIMAVTKNNDTLEAPYVVKERRNSSPVMTTTLPLINQTQRNGSFFATMELPPGAAAREIMLDFKTENFDYKVKLEGSHNQQDWFTILTDYRLVSIKNSRTDYRFTTLIFTEAKYGWLRIEIPAATNPKLKTASLIKQEADTSTYYTYTNLKQRGARIKDRQETVWYAELPLRVPVSQVQVHIGGKTEYIRPITILAQEGANPINPNAEKPFRSIYSDYLSSYSKPVFDFNTVVTDQIKLVVADYDNLPLTIDSITVKGVEYEAIVRLPAASSYFMVYGSPLARLPVYDIGEILARDPLPKMKLLTAGPEESISDEETSTTEKWWEKEVWLYTLMGVLMVVLGYFTLTMLRKKGN